MKFRTREVTRQSFNDTIANRISKGTLIEGEVKSETDIRIDGRVKGLLHCTAKIVVGSGGAIEGEMHCREACLEGEVTGRVEVTGLLTIKKGAHVEGEIYYRRLIVEEGANISGSLTLSAGISPPREDDDLPKLKPERAHEREKASQTA